MSDVRELRVVLTVKNFDQALALYRDVLGLEQVADWSSEDGRVVLLDAGRATLELFDDAQAEKVDAIEAGRRVSGPVRLALEVDDSAATAERLVSAGATRVAQPVTTPWGDRNVRVQAPDGMQLTLFTPVCVGLQRDRVTAAEQAAPAPLPGSIPRGRLTLGWVDWWDQSDQAVTTRVSCENTHSQRRSRRARTSVARSRVVKLCPMNCPLLVVIPVTTAVSPWRRTSTLVDSIDS